MNYIDSAYKLLKLELPLKEYIESIDSNTANYVKVESKNKNLHIYTKNPQKLPKITISSTSSGNEKRYILFVGLGCSEKLHINFTGDTGFVYLADNTKWTSFRGDIILNDGAQLFVGKGVSSWGLKANIAYPGAVISDDVMFGHYVYIRTHSGHCFIDLENDEVRTYSTPLLIEPHVWIGEHVKIFNTKTIGSCSVLSYASVVTSSVPRLATIKGSPGVINHNSSKLWARSIKPRDLEKAKYFYNRFIISSL